MRSSICVSIGLTTPDGFWIGIRIKREIHRSVADRNVEAIFEGQKTGGGPFAQNERPSHPVISKPGTDSE